MGKRIEDLRGHDFDLDHPIPASAVSSPEHQPWYQFVGAIDALIDSGDYDWAFDSLDGIRETVRKTQRVSEGQQRAVANIELRGLDRRRHRHDDLWGR